MQFHWHLTLMAQVLISCWIQCYLPSWKKQSSDIWVVALFFFSSWMTHSTGLCPEWLQQPCVSFYVQVLCLQNQKCLIKYRQSPCYLSVVNLFDSSVISSTCLSSSFFWVRSHLWKFATWRFISAGDLLHLNSNTDGPASSKLPSKRHDFLQFFSITGRFLFRVYNQSTLVQLLAFISFVLC